METALRRRVLIADDNRDAAESLGLLLEMEGTKSLSCTMAAKAIVAFDKVKPDAALLDIGMPGQNGYEIARYIRRSPHGRDVLLIAVTGWGQDNDKAQAVQAGFNHHFTKPVEPDALAACSQRPGRNGLRRRVEVNRRSRRRDRRKSPRPSLIRGDPASMISAQEALARLREGNRRFVGDSLSTDVLASTTRRRARDGLPRSPFVVILGCSDSRVPAEMVFDQGLGRSVRHPGGRQYRPRPRRSAASSSRRNAYGLRLVVVLGHSNCGAILGDGRGARVAARRSNPAHLRSHRRSHPPFRAGLPGHADRERSPLALVHYAVRQNIRMSAITCAMARIS